LGSGVCFDFLSRPRKRQAGSESVLSVPDSERVHHTHGGGQGGGKVHSDAGFRTCAARGGTPDSGFRPTRVGGRGALAPIELPGGDSPGVYGWEMERGI